METGSNIDKRVLLEFHVSSSNVKQMNFKSLINRVAQRDQPA